MNNCINLKIKLNRTLYCKKRKKIITIDDCKLCKYKEYKNKPFKPLKNRTYKTIKLEKNRFSIIYSDLTKCCVKGCNSAYNQVEINEVFEGSYRCRSIKYGAVCPMCKQHHDLFHKDKLFNLRYKLLFQKELISCYSLDWFIKVFGQNYKVKLNKIKSTKI